MGPNLELTGRMAFVSTRDNTPSLPVQALYVMDADGSGQTRLTEDDSLVVDTPDWSPDGSRIVFIGREFITGFAAGIHVVDADGGSNMTTLLEPDSLPARHPAWAPDGSTIAFSTLGGGIYTIESDGSSLTELTDGHLFDSVSDEDPTWSPDGTKIAFVRRDNGQEIFVMNADGSNRTNLTNTVVEAEIMPAWSPDGSKIAYMRGHDIWVMDADGSNQVNLTNSSAEDRYPAWSPDGSKITFSSDEDGIRQEIFIMRADGTDLVRITTIDTGGNYQPSWTSSP